MLVATVVSRRLDGVADGVAVVEYRAQPALPLIGGHHRGLDLHIAGDQPVERLRIQLHRHHLLEAVFQKGEQLLIADQRMLDYLGHPRHRLAAG